jgi:hypothetical protein
MYTEPWDEYDACDVTLSVYHTGQAWKICLSTGLIPTVDRDIFQAGPGGYALRVTSQASYSPEYIASTQKISW